MGNIKEKKVGWEKRAKLKYTCHSERREDKNRRRESGRGGGKVERS